MNQPQNGMRQNITSTKRPRYKCPELQIAPTINRPKLQNYSGYKTYKYIIRSPVKSFSYVLDANVKRLSAYLKLGIFFTLFFGVVDIFVRLSKVGWKCEPMFFCLIYMCWPGGKCTQGPAFPTPPRPPTPPPSPISKFYPPHFRSL